MQHLMTEALARLVDETPGQDEAEHLRGCDACRAELEAMRRDAAALARLGPIDPPADDWPALADRLVREGVVAGAGRHAWRMRVVKVAAALALYAGGAATGVALRGRPVPVALAPASQTTSGQQPAQAPAAITQPAPAAEPASGRAESPENARFAAASPSEVVGRGASEDDIAAAKTPEQALRVLRAAERRYTQAYGRYAELTSAQRSEPEDPVARVAALESIVLTTRAALDRAPADPVINGYHLTAVAQRDAALRQIAMRPDSRWF